jgi:hypothetical protein
MFSKIALFLGVGIVAIACGGASSSDVSGNAASDLSGSGSIATCAPGLSIPVPVSRSFVKCSIASDKCATPGELCKLAADTKADDGSKVGGNCVCDPRRVNEPSPGKQDCKAIGNVCVSKSECGSASHGGMVRDATCTGEGVCCENYITSPKDSGCAGAHKGKDSSCLDGDDGFLASICCEDLK